MFAWHHLFKRELLEYNAGLFLRFAPKYDFLSLFHWMLLKLIFQPLKALPLILDKTLFKILAESCIEQSLTK